ncbi:MAG: hypothetical protein AAF889_05565 [Cyanobacteria bacterium P01_D01_bin.73]
MIHGLMWLPLLGVFIGLAYAGWNEYQRLEAYKVWAVDFERAKYDVRAALGQQDRHLTWGKPTRQGLTNLQTVSLDQIQTLRVRLDQELVDPQAIAPETLDDNPYPKAKSIAIELVLDARADSEGRSLVTIPFTDSVLALRWGQTLQKLIDTPTRTPSPSNS